MAGIGEDIKDVLAELGTPFIIYKSNGTMISGEYLDYEHYYEQSTEFIRQFCYSGDFSYDSKVENGDLLFFDDKYFLVLNVKKTLFESEAVDFSNFFIVCNCTNGIFKKEINTRDAGTKKATTSWVNVPITGNIKGLQVEGAIANQTEIPRMEMPRTVHTLFCQNIGDIRPGYRWYPNKDDSTEYFKVTGINKYRYTNCFVIHIEQEER